VCDVKEKKRVNVSISLIEKKELVNLKEFEFDWQQEVEHEIYKLTVSKSTEVIGLMSFERYFEELRIEIRLLEISRQHVGKLKKYERVAGILIAFACKESFVSGFYGFVSLVPKARLIQHYKTKYGFKQFGRHLAVEFESSEKLINKYLINEEN